MKACPIFFIKTLGYGVYLHGEAVAVGMLMAAKLSALEGFITDKEVQQIVLFHTFQHFLQVRNTGADHDIIVVNGVTLNIFIFFNLFIAHKKSLITWIKICH
jgi:3-dehydroquinate synthetase